jgi:hypothetical protein
MEQGNSPWEINLQQIIGIFSTIITNKTNISLQIKTLKRIPVENNLTTKYRYVLNNNPNRIQHKDFP